MFQCIFILLIPESCLINEGVLMFSNIVFRLGKQLSCKCFSEKKKKKDPWLPASNCSAMSIQFSDCLALDCPAGSDYHVARTSPLHLAPSWSLEVTLLLRILFRIHLNREGQQQQKINLHEVADKGDYISLIRLMFVTIYLGICGLC